MKLADWMTSNGIDDAALAAKVETDRTTINRVKRGAKLPSMHLALRLKAVSGGLVTPNDFAPEPAPASA